MSNKFKVKVFSTLSILLLIFINCETHSSKTTLELFNQKFKTNENILKIIGRTSGTTPEPNRTSLANILLIDDRNPQQPQTPLIFTSEDNLPELPLQLSRPIDDNIFIVSSSGTVIRPNNRPIGQTIIERPIDFTSGKPTDPALQHHRQPPFFVNVEDKHQIRSVSHQSVPNSNLRQHTNNQILEPSRNVPNPLIGNEPKPEQLENVSDPLLGIEPQPLPASTLSLDQKQNCVVLGRAGKCIPIGSFPFLPIRHCFSTGGIAAMDVVRCSWLKACCVHNFVR